MENAEKMTPEFWVEKNKVNDALNHDRPLITIEHFSLPTKINAICKAWLKAKKITPSEFYNAVFGILCHRFMGRDSVTYGFAHAYKSKNTLYSNNKINFVTSNIDSTLTVAHYIKTASKRLKKSTDTYNARYLLMQKSVELRSKKHIKLSIDQYPFILMFDTRKIGALTIYYHTLRFESHDIKSIADHIIEIIQALCQSTSQYITQLPVLTSKEHAFYYDQLMARTVTGQFNLNESIGQIFCNTAKRYPHTYAVYDQHHKLSYQELDALSSILANYLSRQQVKPGNVVGVYSNRNVLLIVYMLAILKIGAVFLPINAKLPHVRINYILENSRPKVLLSDQSIDFSDVFNGQHITLTSLDKIQALSDQLDQFSLPPLTSDKLAYIVYTSGTTGYPKGVMIAERSLINLTNWYVSNFSISVKDRASQFAQQGSDAFFCETIPFLLIGASIHIVDDQIKLTPYSFFEWLYQNKITICDIPTAYAKVLLALQWPAISSLRILKIGGESINRYPEHIYSFDIWNTYGPSETTIETTFKKIYTAYSSPNDQRHFDSPTIGKSLPNTTIWVVDQHNQLVPHGVVGELLIGGMQLAKGYVNNPEKTREKFIPHLFTHQANEQLYRTGDLVKVATNGDLEYIGRVDDQVNIRGFKVKPTEIESMISQHPEVRDVAVIVKETYNREQNLLAYIVPDLDHQRFVYQERCLLAVKDRCIEALTENISKGGLKLSSVNELCTIGDAVLVTLRLPGVSRESSLRGSIIWKQNNQCGIAFDLNDEEKKMVSRSIEFYLSAQNTQDILARSAIQRNLKTILKQKLPAYMVPTSVISLIDMPLNLSGKVDKRSLPEPEQYLQRDNVIITPHTEKEKKLYEIWCDLLHKQQISLADSFFDLGGNSLLVAELSIKILETFGTLIPINVLFDLPYLSIQAEYLETGGTKYNTQSHVQELIEKDLQLPEHLCAIGQLSPHLSSPKNILLIGVDEFLGVFLLKSLLENTDATLYCMIRKNDFESPAESLITIVEQFKLQDDINLSNRRIVLLGGDLTAENFGLSSHLYQILAQKIDLIYHCGRKVNTMASYDVLRVANVFGMMELIKFATHVVDKPIHYISTLFAAYQHNAQGQLYEALPTTNYDHLSGGYALSMWVSERLLTEIQQRGLPVTIYRCGYLGGSTKTGATNLNDSLLMLIKGCIQLGLAPIINEKITFLPVDFVSLAITSISLKSPKRSAVYHVDHPIGITWLDMVAWINQYGYKIQLISLLRWQKMLSMISKQNAIYPLLPYYLSIKEDDITQAVDLQHFMQALTACHLTCPDIDSKLLTLYFGYLQSVNYLPVLPITSKIKEHL